MDRIISRGSEGLYQIENTPEVALLHGEDVLEDSVLGVMDPATPVVVKKPLKIDDGSSTISPKRALKRSQNDPETDQNKSKVAKVEVEEQVNVAVATPPSTVSRYILITI